MLEQYGTPDGRTRRPSLSLRGLGSIFVGGRWYVVIRVPKSLRAKRELLKHAPKIVEKGKKMLILYGTKTSAVLNSVLADLFHPKRDHAVKYTKKDSIMRFERGGETSPEFFSLESECSLLISGKFHYYGSHSKMRPTNLVLGRIYDHHIYDLTENYKSIESYVYVKKLAPKLGTKPFFAFIGEQFESVEELKNSKEMLVDHFNGEVVDNLNLVGVDRIFVCRTSFF
ncbi:ribosome production factor 2 homolog [Lolium perenne]|uniref:ribosome production factor 2 homolog n=1 Tax=Lolium perenne TaxID=4522 RepID=UPI0021F61BC7|nr:ribosome production factor 2 homolog [Lolium perenne]